MIIGIVIVVAGIAGVLLQRYHAAISAEQAATAEVLAAERETLTGWACRLVAHEARTRPHSARCATAAECLRNLSKLNALTVALYDRAHEDLTEDALESPVGEASDGVVHSSSEAVTPWVDSL